MNLPEPLADLVPFLERWSTPDLSLRIETLSRASDSDLSQLTTLVLPRSDAIDAYLNSFGDRPLDETARSLLRLAECAVEARQELEERHPQENDTE